MLTACLLAVGLTLLSAAPQASPDFSGRWVLESPESAPPDVPRVIVVRSSWKEAAGPDGRQAPPFEELTIHRELEDGVRVDTVTVGIQSGTVSGIPAVGTRPGKTAYRSVQWSEGFLVFESGTYTGLAPEEGEWEEQRETWSLAPGKGLQVTTTSRGSKQPARAVTFTYRRN